MTTATASLQTPLVVVLAVAGYAVARPWKRFQLDRWVTAQSPAVYAVFAAPVVLVGATFAGYVRLDDTATFMSFLDRAAAHGYGAAGLAPSTYKATLLDEGYKFGYPLGSMLPIDVGHTLVGVDQLWLWQPYLTFLAALTGPRPVRGRLGIPAVPGAPSRCGVLRRPGCAHLRVRDVGRSQGALPPGVLLFAVCLVPRVKVGTPRQVIPLAAASAASSAG